MPRNSVNREMVGQIKSLDFSAIQSQMSFLEGKVLTIVEAAMPEGRQLKAVKDLVRTAFNDQITFVSQLCYPDLPMKTEGELLAQGIDPEAAILEAQAI